MISVAVLTPGITGRPSSWQRCTTSALSPGETTNPAPASWARSTWSAVRTVPGADHQVAPLGEAAQDRRGVRRAEGDLRDRQTARDESSAEVVGTSRRRGRRPGRSGARQDVDRRSPELGDDGLELGVVVQTERPELAAPARLLEATPRQGDVVGVPGVEPHRAGAQLARRRGGRCRCPWTTRPRPGRRRCCWRPRRPRPRCRTGSR